MQIGTIRALFAKAVEIENSMAGYYRLLAERSIAEEHKNFFNKLAEEEENHAKMLELQQRTLIGNKKVNVERHVDLEELSHVLLVLKDALRIFDGFAPVAGQMSMEMLISEAVKAAMEFEEAASLAHPGKIVSYLDEKTGGFFRKLAADDRNHIERLRDFYESGGGVARLE